MTKLRVDRRWILKQAMLHNKKLLTMNQISWRHHYIPQFYLNGFTNRKGSFKIFDIQKNRFVKDGKDFYPESYFFEEDGNSMITENSKSDFIEEAFKKIDSKTAEILKRINTSTLNDNYNINADDIAWLQYFIGYMYWRIPYNYEIFKSKIKGKKLEDIGIQLIGQQGRKVDVTELEKKLLADSYLLKFMKILYPNITLSEFLDCDTPVYIKPVPDGLPSICSDNPIICRDPSTFRVYSDDFIFPLTSNKLFIRGKNVIKCKNTIKVEIDLLIYKQAEKYVCCTDERYIRELEKIFQTNYRNLDDLRFSIFKQILNYAT